jgi:hypothetical protein
MEALARFIRNAVFVRAAGRHASRVAREYSLRNWDIPQEQTSLNTPGKT